MLKKIAVRSLILAVLGYIAGIATMDVFVYILSFAVLALVVFFGLLVLMAGLIWKLLPLNLKKTYDIKRRRFNATILLSVPLVLIGAKAVNKDFLSDVSGLITLLGNAGIFVFAVFLVWSLIKRSKWRTIFAGSGIFVLFITLLLFVNSVTSKSFETESVDSTEKLKSLGYVSWVPVEEEKDIEKAGVTQYDPELASDGVNIYNSRSLPEAYLIDMQGNIVHKWAKKASRYNRWQHIEMCENGDLLVLAKDEMLIRLDWDSRVKWKKRMRVHHDISVGEDKKMYVITRQDKLVFWHGIPVPILGDYITILSPDGNITKKICLYDLVKEQIPLHRIVEIYRWILKSKNLKRIFKRKVEWNYICEHADSFDIMHSNSIEVIDRDIEGFCKKGDYLISIRELDLIAVLNPEKGEFVWTWGPGQLSRQHHPTLLENKNILIFDNGPDRKFTRIVELNPLTKKIVWEYKAEPTEKFFSRKRGGNQRLPNGNTLITESDKGHVFEITKEGKVVWDFYNPDIGTENQQRGTIYRMIRITDPKRYTQLGIFK